MITLNFDEKGTSFPVNYKLLKIIAENLPNDKSYEKLADALLALGIPSINESIAASFYDSMKTDQRDMLWDSGDKKVREIILRHSGSFCRNLTEERVRQLMAEDDKKILICIAENSEDLFPNEDQNLQIPESVVRELMLFIKNHHDPEIRAALTCNYGTPNEFRMTFAELLDAELVDHAHYAVSSITAEDVENLKKANRRDFALVLANYLEIAGKTKKIRKELAEWLLHYPDPEVRMELAGNSQAPLDVLRRLLEDSEPDVVQTVRNTLAERDDNVLDEE